jgi:prepilin peptidase CpaA
MHTINQQPFFTILFIAIILIISCITDIYNHRIPNWLTIGAATVGVCWNTYINGLSGLFSSFTGILLGVALLIVFYILGGTGAGDVKLMGAIGTFLGPWGVLNAFLWTALAGGLYAIGLIFFHSQLKLIRTEIFVAITGYFATRKLSFNKSQLESKKPKLCYGVAIAIGTVISLFIKVI